MGAYGGAGAKARKNIPAAEMPLNIRPKRKPRGAAFGQVEALKKEQKAPLELSEGGPRPETKPRWPGHGGRLLTQC